MAPRLDTIPCDILQHIAFICSTSSIFKPPVDVLHLLLTCRVFYQLLNVHEAPHIYANIFCAKFDTQVSFRRYGRKWNDSALAGELLSRYRLLRRCHRRDFSVAGLVQDLWTAVWMLLENDLLNIQQLYKANFHEFIFDLVRSVSLDHDPKQIVVCLLSLALGRRTILEMTKEDRDELYNFILPCIFLPRQPFKPLRSPPQPCIQYLGRDHARTLEDAANVISSHNDRHDHVYTYLQSQGAIILDPSTAAINLASVILECTPVRIPSHLPETRAIANANQRSGPTQEDFKTLAAYQTLLLADLTEDYDGYPATKGLVIPSALDINPSRHCDVRFGEILKALDHSESSNRFSYAPGTITGLWEGIFRTVDPPNKSCSPPPDSFDLLLTRAVFIKPLQCALVEYICAGHAASFSPQLEGDILDSPICFPNLFDPKSSLEVHIRGRKYKRYSPQMSIQRCDDPSHNDILMLGETLEDHDQAWGAYRFFGKVQMNGRLSLKREAKDEANRIGTQIFEGCLTLMSLVVGRWTIVGNGDSSLGHGIFSLVKSRVYDWERMI